jgi:uncharacterized membrane protein
MPATIHAAASGVRRPDCALGPAPARTVGLAELALVIAFAGCGAAGVLSLAHILDLPVPCGGRGGCNAVAHHPSSRVFGVPIAYLGIALYATAAALLGTALTAPRGRLALVVLTGTGAVASVALTVYSVRVIGATCGWCLVSAGLVTALFTVSLALWRRPPVTNIGARPMWWLALALSAFLGIEAGLMVKAAAAPPIAAARLRGLGPTDLDVAARALGPLDAPVTVVMFADLACPACRRAYDALVTWQRANAGAVRLVYRHQPLWETSAAAAAIAEIGAESGRFWPFVEALHERPQFTHQGFRLAAEAAGLDFDTVERRVADPADSALVRLRDDAALAERLGIHSTPTFVLFVRGAEPRSAGPASLPGLLNSAFVRAQLISAQAGAPRDGK